MAVKNRGIQLKKSLRPEDQGQRKLLQVTYSQLAFLNAGGAAEARPTVHQPSAPAHQGATDNREEQRRISETRRRAIARMLRIELESTLKMLNQAVARHGD